MENMDLFKPDKSEEKSYEAPWRPLADRLRPQSWEDFKGLDRLDKNLTHALQRGRGAPPSLILWGPPGSGKTTFAKLIGRSFDCYFVQESAVLIGVKQVREIIAQARRIPQPTLLFVDEIHRFNKAQQDAFLPHVENGTIALIGATTENPSFYLNGALLSRVRVIQLNGLSSKALRAIARKACDILMINLAEDAIDCFAELAGGDARRFLNLLEHFAQSYQGDKSSENISREVVETFLKDSKTFLYDRDGDEHYNMASAFIKSLRGSNPDAALYWAFRMIESGDDPRFITRRMMIFASEDIGNADPRALQFAVATAEAFERLGMPEGEIPIANCITYLASAPKSNRSYLAMHAAKAAVKQHAAVSVPLHLRNAPTKLMKELDYGSDYQYPHDYEEGYVKDVQYLPDELKDELFYKPGDRGYEQRIKERLERFRGK